MSPGWGCLEAITDAKIALVKTQICTHELMRRQSVGADGDALEWTAVGRCFHAVLVRVCPSARECSAKCKKKCPDAPNAYAKKLRPGHQPKRQTSGSETVCVKTQGSIPNLEVRQGFSRDPKGGLPILSVQGQCDDLDDPVMAPKKHHPTTLPSHPSLSPNSILPHITILTSGRSHTSAYLAHPRSQKAAPPQVLPHRTTSSPHVVTCGLSRVWCW